MPTGASRLDVVLVAAAGSTGGPALVRRRTYAVDDTWPPQRIPLRPRFKRRDCLVAYLASAETSFRVLAAAFPPQVCKCDGEGRAVDMSEAEAKISCAYLTHLLTHQQGGGGVGSRGGSPLL